MIDHLPSEEWRYLSTLGWTEEQYRQLPECFRSEVDRCRKGEISDSEVEIPEEITNDIRIIQDRVIEAARHFLEREVVTEEKIQACLLRLKIATEPISAEFCQEVRMATIANMLFGVRLALEEALVNHLRHGNKCDPRLKVSSKYRLRKGVLETVTADEGPGFNRADIPDPTDESFLEKPTGRGLMLMGFYMDEVADLHHGAGFNMQKKLVPDSIDKYVTKAHEELKRAAADKARSSDDTSHPGTTSVPSLTS